MVNKTSPCTSHGTGKISKVSRFPFSFVYKTKSLKVSRHGQSVLLYTSFCIYKKKPLYLDAVYSFNAMLCLFMRKKYINVF